MGALEKLRGIVMGSPSPFKRAAIEGAAEIWGYHGCPGYEPAPWGKVGDVPTKDGVYALHVDVDSKPLVVVITIRGGVVSMEGNPETISVTAGGAGPIRLRYLCPLPTPPEDV